MPSIFEILNQLCRKYPLSLIGGFCLTGLCFGTEKFSGMLHHTEVRKSQYHCSDNVEKPLCGNGVMFFDQNSQVVRKIDDFAYEPSNIASLADYEPASEPKRLQLKNHDDDGITQNIQMAPVPFLSEMTCSQEHFPTRLVSSVVQERETVWHDESQMVRPQFLITSENLHPRSEHEAQPSEIWAEAVQINATAMSSNGSPNDYTRFENTAERIAGNNHRDDTTVRVAVHFKNDAIDQISTDTGDLYVTRDQLDRIFEEYKTSQAGLAGRKGPFTITPYGYINVSTSYESERTARGDFALYSLSPDLDGGGHSGFHVDPKSSRLGLKVDGPTMPWQCRCIKTSALVEIDFQGSNFAGTRNRGSVMLRRAFVDFEHGGTRLLVGQEWDVVSPLVPQSLNYVPGSNAGNLGYRRAQLRIERTRKWNDDFTTIWQLAVCDNVPTDYLTDSTVNIANSGWPMMQGRLGVSFGRNPRADCEPITVGISTHVGELTHDYKAYNINKRRHETWSVNLDADVPLTSRTRLSGELYTGTNLSTMLAGIGQGVDLFSPGSNVFNPRSADAYGGWINLNHKLSRKFQINAGYCIERMEDLVGSTPIGGNQYSARDKNQVLFFNGIYHWTDHFLTGLEASQWRTDWHIYQAASNTIQEAAPGETTRIDFLMRYSF